MLNTSWHRKITNVGIERVIFNSRPLYNLVVLLVTPIAMQGIFADLSSQNAFVEHIQKV